MRQGSAGGSSPPAERSPRRFGRVAMMSTGGEVANALVCKTSIHGFKSHPVLHRINDIRRHKQCCRGKCREPRFREFRNCGWRSKELSTQVGTHNFGLSISPGLVRFVCRVFTSVLSVFPFLNPWSSKQAPAPRCPLDRTAHESHHDGATEFISKFTNRKRSVHY